MDDQVMSVRKVTRSHLQERKKGLPWLSAAIKNTSPTLRKKFKYSFQETLILEPDLLRERILIQGIAQKGRHDSLA